MSIGILTLTISLPNSHSLKEKRRQIKPILARLHREFNISVAESDHQDIWQTCEILVVCAASRGNYIEKTLEQVITFFEKHWPDLPLLDEKIEIII